MQGGATYAKPAPGNALRGDASVQAPAFTLILLSLVTGFVVVIEPAPTDMFFALGFGLLVIVAGSRLYVPRSLYLVYGLLLAYVVLSVISLYQAHVVTFGLRYFLITLYLLLIPPVFVHFNVLFGRSAADRMQWAFILGATFSAIVGLMALLHVAPGPATLYFKSDDGLRLSPLFKDPNVFGPYMSAAGLLLVSRMCCQSARRRFMGFALAGFILLMMFLAFSRGAWINSAIAAATFVFGMLVFGRSWRQIKWVLILLLIASVAMLVAMPLLLDELGLTQFLADRARLQGYDDHRFENWENAFGVIVAEPLGIGPGHYVGRNDFAQSAFDLATHNLYLKVAVENGWLSFLSFFGAIGCILAMLLGSFFRRDARLPIRIMIFAIILGQLANSLAVDSLHWRHLFVLLGFACGEIALFRRA
ncbi:O-antigen ligase family protein [Aestuariicoccus sp. MJ-SS9]|uniref:O-antigen ligase family protein n=1 Tax=Aestuariicoccus sp. MJ-SS9 TaxID=3079855 RepID=UPI00290BEC97|nr:O-antigen ligase family protein [Aestuariicoccus sp. MJ-SS9]MDU8913850.1 O-antigen ligase family protein [Aestuariicoccus sp. MJ-SS9]